MSRARTGLGRRDRDRGGPGRLSEPEVPVIYLEPGVDGEELSRLYPDRKKRKRGRPGAKSQFQRALAARERAALRESRKK